MGAGSDGGGEDGAEAGEKGSASQPWLSRGVAGIGTASFLADLGHEVPTTLLPSLLTSTLGAPAAALGFIEGILGRPGRGRSFRWWGAS
jgi:hypothetical protein